MLDAGTIVAPSPHVLLGYFKEMIVSDLDATFRICLMQLDGLVFSAAGGLWVGKGVVVGIFDMDDAEFSST